MLQLFEERVAFLEGEIDGLQKNSERIEQRIDRLEQRVDRIEGARVCRVKNHFIAFFIDWIIFIYSKPLTSDLWTYN